MLNVPIQLQIRRHQIHYQINRHPRAQDASITKPAKTSEEKFKTLPSYLKNITFQADLQLPAKLVVPTIIIYRVLRQSLHDSCRTGSHN